MSSKSKRQTGFTVKLNPQSLAALDRWRSKLAFPFSRNAGANFLVKLAAKHYFGWPVTKMRLNEARRGGQKQAYANRTLATLPYSHTAR